MLFSFDLLIGIGGNQKVASLQGFLLGATHDVGEKRIGNIRQHHAKHVGLLDFQAARNFVGMVVHLADRRFDPLAQLAANLRVAA